MQLFLRFPPLHRQDVIEVLPVLLVFGDPSNMFGPVMKIIGQIAFALPLLD